MFFCKVQVAGWQIFTSSTLSATSYNSRGIWSQHADSPIKTIFGKGASLGIRGLQKNPKKIIRIVFQLKVRRV